VIRIRWSRFVRFTDNIFEARDFQVSRFFCETGKTIPVSSVDRLQYEREHVSRGINRLGGVDEAGRGPLAGPVVAAVIVMPELWIEEGVPEALRRLNDSKKLNAKVREELFEVIDLDKSIEYGIGVVDAPLIDEINILQATYQAMNEALAKIAPPVQHALVDGRPVRSLSVSQTAIVKGDGKSYTIGAASILAKVTRDRLMIEYDQKYPGYGFAGHKGYGTRAHLSAIEKLGPCPIHRMSFAPLSNTQTELFS